MLLRGPTTITTITNSVILASNALAGVVSARALGPASRGQLAIVMLWSALISMVGSLGLLSSCSYHVAIWPDRRLALAAWLRRVGARQATVMTVTSAAVMWWLHLRLHLAPLLMIEYMTWAGASVITVYGTCYAQGLGDFAKFNVMRAIPGSMPAVLMIASAVAIHLTLAEAGAAYLIPTWFSAILAAIWLRRGTANAQIRPLSKSERRSMWSYGWRSLGSFSSLTLNSNGDQLALGIIVPLGSLGLYSVAASASSPLTSMVASLGMVGLPAVAAQVGRAKVIATWRILRRAIVFLAIVAPAIAVLLPWAIPFVYGTHYEMAVVPAEVLLVGGTFTALASVTDDLLRAHGHPGFVCVTQGMGALITVIGTLLLGGRPLVAVAFVSSSGFFVAFALAIVRLRQATYRIRSDCARHVTRSDFGHSRPATGPRKNRVTILLDPPRRTRHSSSVAYSDASPLNSRKAHSIRQWLTSEARHRRTSGVEASGRHRRKRRAVIPRSRNSYT